MNEAGLLDFQLTEVAASVVVLFAVTTILVITVLIAKRFLR